MRNQKIKPNRNSSKSVDFALITRLMGVEASGLLDTSHLVIISWREMRNVFELKSVKTAIRNKCLEVTGKKWFLCHFNMLFASVFLFMVTSVYTFT